MLKTLLLAAATLALTGGATLAQSAEDRAALAALAQASDAHWDRRDAAGLSSVYTEDGAVIMAGTTRLDGREAIRRHFEQSLARTPEGMRHVTDITGLTFLDSDTAFVDADVRLERPQGEGWAVAREFRIHTVAKRQADGRWLTRLVRTHVKPAPAA